MAHVPRRRTARDKFGPDEFVGLLVDVISGVLRPKGEPRQQDILAATERAARSDADMITALSRLSSVAASDPAQARSILTAFFAALIQARTLVARVPVKPKRGRPREWTDDLLSDLDALVAGVKGKERSRQTGDRIRNNFEAIVYLMQDAERMDACPRTSYWKLAPKAKTWATLLSSFRARKKARLKKPDNCSE